MREFEIKEIDNVKYLVVSDDSVPDKPLDSVNYEDILKLCSPSYAFKYEQRNFIFKKIHGYDWSDITDISIEYYIGAWWQAGLGHGLFNGECIAFVYHGSPRRNETFHTVVKISDEELVHIQEEYSSYLSVPENKTATTMPDYALSALYHTFISKNCNTIMEGWDLI